MKEISITLEGEKAVFTWKEGKGYTEDYDLESERAALALTGYGKGIGVLFVAMNDCCKSEAEFMREGSLFVAGYKEIISRTYKGWPKGQLLFEYLSYSSDLSIRWGGVFAARLSDLHYKRMLGDPDINIKIRMGSLEELPEKYFHALVKLSNSEINYNLAVDKRCPSDVLFVLAQDKEDGVRECVAANTTCPEGTLKTLAYDKVGQVRWYVAANDACPQGVLELLAQDNDANVRLFARETLEKKNIETGRVFI